MVAVSPIAKALALYRDDAPATDAMDTGAGAGMTQNG